MASVTLRYSEGGIQRLHVCVPVSLEIAEPNRNHMKVECSAIGMFI